MPAKTMEYGSKANTESCSELRHASDEIQVTPENTTLSFRQGKLALFEYRPLPNESGGIAFVGGPVSALEFHPTAKGICALSAHPDSQSTHEILTCYQGKAHIQLWNFSTSNATCIGVIPHEGNCAWDLKWKSESHSTPHNDDTRIRGTLAAALGDGTVHVYFIDFTPSNTTPTLGTAPKLTPKKVILRDNGLLAERVPVHVVQWSTDGQLLVIGASDGSIEIYQATVTDKPWSKWSIPGHESVIMDLRWLSATHLCSLGLSCVLRLRDIRDPVAVLEQNAEGLSGSLSMDTLEPNVAVVGGDYGYLRVVRMSGADGEVAKLPVKRVHLQSGAFRDMKSIPIPGKKGEATQTLFYTGGGEGILHECLFPRPIWSSTDLCNIGRTHIRQKLHWSMRTEGEGLDTIQVLNLDLGERKNEQEDKTESHGRNADEDITPTRVESRASTNHKDKTTANKKTYRKSRAVGKVTEGGKDYSVFGESYNQKSVITRLSVSRTSDLLALGIDGGIVTIVPLNLDNIQSAAEKAREAAQAAAAKKKILKPLRKRGRPRKYPVQPISSVDTVASVDTSTGEENVTKKKEIVQGPKRKRGRPRKSEAGKSGKSEGKREKQVGFKGKAGVGDKGANGDIAQVDDESQAVTQPMSQEKGDEASAATATTQKEGKKVEGAQERESEIMGTPKGGVKDAPQTTVQVVDKVKEIRKVPVRLRVRPAKEVEVTSTDRVEVTAVEHVERARSEGQGEESSAVARVAAAVKDVAGEKRGRRMVSRRLASRARREEERKESDVGKGIDKDGAKMAKAGRRMGQRRARKEERKIPGRLRIRPAEKDIGPKPKRARISEGLGDESEEEKGPTVWLKLRVREERKEGEGGRSRRMRKPSWKVMDR